MQASLSIFLNSVALMAVGACCAYLGMGACFEKRHSSAVFWVYMALKALVWAAHDAQELSGAIAGNTAIMWWLAISIIGVLTYIVLYYTWDASLCKIGWVAIFTDAFCAITVMALVFVSNLLFGQPPVSDYRTPLGPWTVFIALGTIAAFLLLRRLANPLIRWFTEYDIVHERFWLFIVACAVMSSAITRMDYESLTGVGAAFVATMMAVALACLGFYVRQRLRAERRRSEILMRERLLASEYDRALGPQLDYLASSSAALDAISREAKRIGGAVDSVGLADYALQLGKVCERLRHGLHSDCPALDVVLTGFETEYAANGLRAEYRIAPLGGAANQAALVSHAMLNWALAEYGGRQDAGGDASCESEGKKPQTVKLRIARKGNQLVFVMEAPSKRKARFPKRLLEECNVSFQGALLEDDDGFRKTVRALVGEDQAWEANQAGLTLFSASPLSFALARQAAEGGRSWHG